MESEPYESARWSYLVVDPATDEVIYSQGADGFMLIASMSKEFTVGTTYDVIGPDATITTPVFATAAPTDGTVAGDLVLVAKGDLAMGARGAAEGRFDFTPDAPDHVYGDVLPGSKRLAEDDPLVGLDDLAAQVAASGVTQVDGDVLIDDRIWDEFDSQEGPVPPIFVNDNLLDFEVTPGEPGEPATVAAIPETTAYAVTVDVETGEADSDAALEVTADESDPRLLTVSGSVPPGAPSLTVYRVPDAAAWARTLFIEALADAGVTVSAPALAENDTASLPAADTYTDDLEVAHLISAPLSEMGGMILATSYNRGANTFMCLLAVNEGSTDCLDGLTPIRQQASEAGIGDSELMLMDGQGANPASATPQALIDWLAYIQSQPWGDVFEDGLPVLGERGSLVASGTDSPAKGKVKAKTGTAVSVEPVTDRMFVGVQGLAGYLDVGDGRTLLFVVAASEAIFPDVNEGIFQVGDDVADVAAAFQQAQSE
jgi:D-alanyl-D-alanine carboxypeptidase/D-alanyl-D-alanine-endopeptidase (penicillin-binding protein 4)